MNLSLRLPVFHAFTSGNLFLGHSNVFDQLGTVYQPLVFCDVQKNGGAAAALVENKWGVLERVSRGVYRLSRYPSTAHDSLVEAMLWPQARSGSPIGVISHESALAYYGISEVSPSKINITVPMDARMRRDVPGYLKVHRARLQPAEVRKVDGILVTMPERSLRDAG